MTGLEKVPRHGPVLLASNHVSFLDPYFMLWLSDKSHRRVRFLAMAELWKGRVMRFFLNSTHQIPVPRESAAASGSLVHAEEALRAGECVCIYPEGGISETLELRPGKTGVARLAALTGVPVTPVCVWGAHRVWPKGRKRDFRPGKAVSVVIGDPIPVAADEDPVEATDRIMEGLAKVLATARRDYPQKPKPGEDAWWYRTADTAVAQPTRRDRNDSRWS
jgi:1-acyl-sn-glycerol-3-phosphate acyltransferase